MSEIAAFKGFDKALKCRGFQYVEGETYTHDDDLTLREVRAVQVDGETVKAGVFYRLKGGELVEVDDD